MGKLFQSAWHYYQKIMLGEQRKATPGESFVMGMPLALVPVAALVIYKACGGT